MKIKHIVWVKFHSELPRERIDAHLRAVECLRDLVPGMLSLTVGENFSERAKGFTHGLVIDFEDKDVLASYAAHPRHVEIAAALLEDAELAVMDYEF